MTTYFHSRVPRRRAWAPLLAAVLPWSSAVMAGQARCWIDHGALVAPAAFGDVAGDFLIDLSSPVSQIHLTRAQEDGVAAPTPGGGEVVVRRRLRIAGTVLDDTPLAVADLDDRFRAFDVSLNGVIGADVLRRFVITFTPSPCRLTLTSRDRAVAPPRGRIPLELSGGRPAADLVITDGARIRSGLFVLDTGDWPTTLWGARPGRPEGPGPVRLRALELGGRLYEQVPVRLAPGPPEPLRGRVGLSILSRFRFRLDIADGWLKVDP